MITRKFSDPEFVARFRQYGNDARDDDGILFSEQDPSQFDGLEVAHILPHSLVKATAHAELVCVG